MSQPLPLMEIEAKTGASPVAELGKNPPAVQESPVRFLGWEVPLEKG